MLRYLVWLVAAMVFALWYLLGEDNCGDNGYLEDGECVYE